MLIFCSFFPISWCLKVAIQFLLCCLYSTDTEAPKIAVPKTCNGFVIKPFESSDPAVLLSHEPHSCTIADPLPFSGKLKEDQIWGETPFYCSVSVCYGPCFIFLFKSSPSNSISRNRGVRPNYA